YAIACALLDRSRPNSPMSLPGENARSPAPRTTTQRTASSADSASIATPSSRHIARVSALSFSGRFSSTVAMAPSRSTRIVPLIGSPVEVLHEPEARDRNVGHQQQHGDQHADEPDVDTRNDPDRRLRDR